MNTLRTHFFAGATAAFAMIVVAYVIGYNNGLSKSPKARLDPRLVTLKAAEVPRAITSIDGATITVDISSSNNPQSFLEIETTAETEFSKFELTQPPQPATQQEPVFIKPTEKKITLADFKVGDNILFISAAMQSATHVTARKVILIPPLPKPISATSSVLQR